MKLTKDELLKLARLSRLQLSENELQKYQEELVEIIEYIKQLDTVNVDDLKPTYQVTGLTSQSPNATREDRVESQIDQSELFKNLPDVENGQIKVKRMIA